MNKADLTAAIAEKTGLSKKASGEALAAVLDTIEESLKKGEAVQLIGFGTFDVRERSERKGRNPRNPEEEIIIPATKVPAFKAGKALKDSVNNK